jgi:starvation-inducible outer membrane lipoprotein
VTERAAPGVYYIWRVNQQYVISPDEIEVWRQRWQGKADAPVTPPPTIP